jgi:hypothetical protein
MGNPSHVEQAPGASCKPQGWWNSLRAIVKFRTPHPCQGCGVRL